MAPAPRRRWPWILAATLGVLLLALAITTASIDEPLRRRLEARLNAQLEGYTVTIGELDLQPIGLALELENVTLVQNAHPKPPVARLPETVPGPAQHVSLDSRLASGAFPVSARATSARRRAAPRRGVPCVFRST